MLQVKKSFFGPFLRPVLANIETCQLIWFFFWLCWEHWLKLAKFLYAGNSALNWQEIYYCFQYTTTIDFCWQSWYLWLSSCQSIIIGLPSRLPISQVFPHAEPGNEAKYVSWSEFYRIIFLGIFLYEALS